MEIRKYAYMGNSPLLCVECKGLTRAVTSDWAVCMDCGRAMSNLNYESEWSVGIKPYISVDK